MTLAFPEIYFLLDSEHVAPRLMETLKDELGTKVATQNEVCLTMAYGKDGCHGREEGDGWGYCMQCVEGEDAATTVRD